MAYGVSSTTVLLAAGVAPALASAAVHMAEIGTTAVSGISHLSFGNVDWSKIVWLAVPGGIGALSRSAGAGLGSLAGSDSRLRRAGGGHIPLHTRYLRPQPVRVQEDRASRQGKACSPRVFESARVCSRVPRRLRGRWLGSHRDPYAALLRSVWSRARSSAPSIPASS